MNEFAYLLTCPTCNKQEFLGLTQAVRRLSSVGMLKREREPNEALVLELLNSALPQLECRHCGGCNLTLTEDEAWEDDAFSRGKACVECGNQIDPERLEVFPDVQLCVACQTGEERGEVSEEPEYCPKCGGIMEVKKVSTGITRYRMRCPSCN